MMVLTHGLSGYVAGRVAMPALGRLSPLPPRTMSWAFFIGAVMPDGDVLTRILLGQTAYFSGAWYAHRQASHSILGTLVLAGIVTLAGFAPRLRLGWEDRRALAWLWGCLWCGGLLHLIGDLPTPGRSLPVFWPLPGRYGSWSHIGWFTPYLWWMFASAVLLGFVLRRSGGLLVARGAIRSGIVVSGSAWGVYTLTLYRWLHYLVISRYESATQFAAAQRALLPDPLVSVSSEWVRFLWRWMVD